MKKNFIVSELSGAACASQVEKSVRAVAGVLDVSINVVTGVMRVSFDERRAQEADILSAVASAGYLARKAGKGGAQEKDRKQAKYGPKLCATWLIALTILYLTVAGALGLPLTGMFAHPLPRGIAQMLLLAPVMAMHREVFSGGVKALRNKAPNTNTLVSLGAAASAAYSLYELMMGAWRVSAGVGAGMHLYFDTSAMILALVSLGKYFEARARKRASAAIARLSRMRPEFARVLRAGAESVVPAQDVQIGETLMVRKGDIVPADGEALSGEGRVDASMFTGEETPVAVGEGDRVTGATVCLSGEFTMRADKPLGEMRVSQILSMVEEAAGTKAPIARMADRVAGIFVPLVMLLSLCTGVMWGLLGESAAFAVKSAVCVLVISCPCALGLATPAAIMTGTGKGAEMGIFIKNAAALEKLKSIDTVVFDKAGTLTAGEMRVTGCVLGEGSSMRALIALAASAEQHSRHPYAQAILREARCLNLPLDPAEDFEDVPGQGVRARVGDMRALVGNLTMMEQSAQDVSAWRSRADALSDDGANAVYVAADGRVRGLIALRDALRPSAVEAVEMLTRIRVKTLMLTGDDSRTAAAIGAHAGVSEVRAGLAPEDKDVMFRILEADKRRVMMVSDGAKDAPAFSRAKLAMTLGSGTDVAIESADVVILRGDMKLVPCAIQLGRMTLRVIKENLFWAFFYNVIGIPVAAGALYPLLGLQFSPSLGAAAMSLSSIFVVVNALRLRRFKPEGDKAAKPALRQKAAKGGKRSEENE